MIGHVESWQTVSIRSRLLGREKRCNNCVYLESTGVSIRSRLLGREKRARCRQNPCAWSCFNPLPAFGPGETGTAFGTSAAALVSIRSRLLGREKPLTVS